MDDILIDEKKYVSSKQAAKITGYAKDYIGQLCREGRVPARLVGRSWYVLETAIQDHRFGDAAIQSDAKEVVKTTPKSLPWTQQAPRYEAAPIEVLPVAPSRVAEPVAQEEVQSEPQENIQNSWKAWFDRVGQTFQQEIPGVVIEEQPESHPEAQNEPEPHVERQHEEEVFEEKYEDIEVNVPIHTMYKAPPRELLPRYAEEVISGAEEELQTTHKREVHPRKGGYRFIKFVAFVLGLGALTIAVLGSGYLDNSLVSVTQIRYISGLHVYNK